MVCIGDSLTHGRVRYNYVDVLDGRFSDDYLCVHVGIKGDLFCKAIGSHYLPGRSWDSIAAKNNFLFLTDFIHLNAKGAGIAADLIEAFIRHN